MSNVTFSISVDSDMMDDSDPVSYSLQSRISYQKGRNDLDLSLCSIANVPLEAIRELYGKVTYLNLSYNRIRMLSFNFVNEMRSTLVSLDLSRNRLKRLPDNFGEFEQLVFLDIHQNKLQSLPLSMGKLTRLTYLNISDNPFGPPLSDFLEYQNRTSNGEKCVINAAHSVINFLAKVSQQSSSTRESSRNLPDPPSPPPVPRQRTVTFVEEISNREKSTSTLKRPIKSMAASVVAITETTGNSEDDDEIKEDEFIPKKYTVEYSDSDLGPYLKKKTETSPTKDPSWSYSKVQGRRGHTLAIPSPLPQQAEMPKQNDWEMYKLYGVIMLVVWLLMFPVIMAMFYETSAVDHLVKGSEFLEPLWKSYRPYHQTIKFGVDFIGLKHGFVVGAPSPQKAKYYDVNPFTAMLYAFREFLASVFQSMADIIQPPRSPV